MEGGKKNRQIDIIKKRYLMDKFNVVPNIERSVLLGNLRNAIEPDHFHDKVILEIGAGCSLFLSIFLDHGCRKLVANDLIEERLDLNEIFDDRYIAVPGEFLDTHFEENAFDVVFAHSTMMFLVPILGEVFEKVHRLLKPGGVFITVDSNYLCPVSIYRLVADRSGANPATLFNPFGFADKARKHGFIVDRLIPFTSNYEWATGIWLLGTSFTMVARKENLL